MRNIAFGTGFAGRSMFVFCAVFLLGLVLLAHPGISFGQYTLTYSDGTVSFNESDTAAYYESQNFSSASAVMQDYLNMSINGGPWGPAHGLAVTPTTNAQGLLTAITCANGVGATATYNIPATTPTTPTTPATPATCTPNGSCSNTCGFGVDNCGNSCISQSDCTPAASPDEPASPDNPWTSWVTAPPDTSLYTGPAVVPTDAYKVIYNQAPQCSTQCVQSNYLYDSCSNTITYCPQGCVGNSCVVSSGSGGTQVPPPTLTWAVSPAIVQKGAKTHVTWQSTNTTNCQVTATNGDSFSGVNGDRQSGAINNQTVYTIICTGTDGSTIQKQATVNIIPVFQEV